MRQSFDDYDDAIIHLNKKKKLTFQGKHILSSQQHIKVNGKLISIYILLYKLYHGITDLIVMLKKECTVLECVSPNCWIKTNILINLPVKNDGSEITVNDLTEEQRNISIERLKENSQRNGNCLFSTLCPNDQGYCSTSFLREKRFVHDCAYELYNNTKIPQGLIVRHTCHKPQCFEEKHLKLGSSSDNMQDKKDNGTFYQGQDVDSAKLTNEQVRIFWNIFQFLDTKLTAKKRYDIVKIFLDLIFPGNLLTYSSFSHMHSGNSWNFITTIETKERKLPDKIGLQEDADFEKAQAKIEDKNNIEIKQFPEMKTPCWLWKKSSQKGYGRISYRGKNFLTHKLSFLAFNYTYELPKGHKVVRHSCRQTLCCNPNHLKSGTYKDNVQDMVRDGTLTQGENHPKAKYKNEEKKEIFEQLNEKTPTQVYNYFKELGNNYSYGTIKNFNAKKRKLEQIGDDNQKYKNDEN